MQTRIEERDGFSLMGTSIRTSNKNEMDPTAMKIPAHWQKFTNEGILKSLAPHATSGALMGLYHTYDNGQSGSYDLTIGTTVAANAKPIAGTKIITVPSSRYVVFTTHPGQIPEVILEGWKYIHEFFDSNDTYVRSFTGDFEVYDERAQDPDKAVIEYYISIK